LNPEDKDYQKNAEYLREAKKAQVESFEYFRKSNSFSEAIDEIKTKQKFFR
jgi:hypothetical protein